LTSAWNPPPLGLVLAALPVESAVVDTDMVLAALPIGPAAADTVLAALPVERAADDMVLAALPVERAAGGGMVAQQMGREGASARAAPAAHPG